MPAISNRFVGSGFIFSPSVASTSSCSTESLLSTRFGAANGPRFSRRRHWQDAPRIPAPKAVGCNRWVRPVFPKPVQTGGWKAKVAGEFGEQRTPNAPRTLTTSVRCFNQAYTETEKTSTRRPTRRAGDKEEELVRSPRGPAAKGSTSSRPGGRRPGLRYGYASKLRSMRPKREHAAN
jgi:hypothetical protein